RRAPAAPGSPGILRLCRNRVVGWTVRRRRPAPSADPAAAPFRGRRDTDRMTPEERPESSSVRQP
ncbi:hypothetical protein N4P33_35280, partial [Streptomyces sp. 15-116A]|uniref:hypothetical protein n=1 Tax=Streptomyces sp. 15-116A TaxID=2259035 RepID=UPI0021B3F183